MSMLKGIWPGWSSDDSRISSQKTQASSLAPGEPSLKYYSVDDIDEEDVASIQNPESLTDDELLDRMMTRFPAYGTRSQAIAQTQPNPLNPTADWLLGGTSNIPNPAQQLRQKQLEEQQRLKIQREKEELAAAAAMPQSQARRNMMRAKHKKEQKPVYPDWDVQEQELWASDESKRNKQSTSESDRDSPTAASEASNTDDDPEQDWLYPYYYHLGVFPKAPKTTPSTLFQQYQRPKAVRTNPIDKIRALQSDAADASPQRVFAKDREFVVVPSKPESAAVLLEANSDDNDTSAETEDGNDGLVDDRQHWMPDQLCNRCYGCDAAFTVFRRRHHCRLCGQIFCNTCAGFFVPANPCNHDGVQLKSQRTPLRSTVSTNKTVLRTCQLCFDQVAKQQDDEKVSTSANLLEGTKPLKHPMISPSPSLQDQLDNEDSVLHNLKEEAKGKLAPLQEDLEFADDEDIDAHLHDLDLDDDDDENGDAASDNGALIPSKCKALAAVLPMSSSRERFERQVSDSSSKRANHKQIVDEANMEMDRLAKSHLEQMAASLLASDAPLLGNNESVRKEWLQQLLALAWKCCTTVKPDCKNNNDLLDIRPYCKIKVISGGACKDCAYISGVMFRKMLIHKDMTEEILEPRIMLLNGGIEFTRAENRITSLNTLLEQETRYMEILVGRILKLKPDILIVGRSVSRKAQELLLDANVVLLQHVQASLLKRISRQTGATIISSTDHIMNQFGADVLGKCHRFRFVVARDNEIWTDVDEPDDVAGQKRNINALLEDESLSNHDRQAVRAAYKLGEGVMDGAIAVKRGLAKRGVARTYIMLEGCPRDLGCTVILRGANKATLKQLKTIFRFLLNVAYNLHLEVNFLKERCARVNENFKIEPRHLFSSSLCVDYGEPPGGRKIWPWNGDSRPNAPHLVEIPNRSLSGEISAFDHQAILITSIWMTDKTQCCTAEVKGICFYSIQDVSLGQFLRDSCFNLSLKCQNLNCRNSVLDHSLSFVHKDGLIKISVDYMAGPLPPGPASDSTRKSSGDSTQGKDKDDKDGSDQIATWTFCNNCDKVVTPLVYFSDETWKYSFGKFLESIFYNHDVSINSPDHRCNCPLQASSSTLFFGCGRLAARFNYERIRPYGVFKQKTLPIDTSVHRTQALQQLTQISIESSRLFSKFGKHIEKVSREARSLFGSAVNRPEHLQTVVSELNWINTEVDHAAKTLQDKITSVSEKCSREDDMIVNEALFRFPWFARRYLYMLTSAWNEKLSAAGQAIVAMKKLAKNAQTRGDSVIGQNVPAAIVGDDSDELRDGMRRLRHLHEVYSRYNLTDITTILPRIPGLSDSKEEIEYDDDFEDPDGAIDFVDAVDADVLASRRRFQHSKSGGSPAAAQMDPSDPMRIRPTKSLGTYRPDDRRSTPDPMPNPSTSAKVTPGGAVKSALTRLFNRGGRDLDPYVVDLGIFNEGRPRLEPGCNGIVVPVFDDRPSTIIAYSLSSKEYANHLRHFFNRDESNQTETPGSSLLGETSTVNGAQPHPSTAPDPSSSAAPASRNLTGGSSNLSASEQDIERQIGNKTKNHIKHTFRDFGEKRQPVCKFVVTTYWATQFHAVRQVFLSGKGGSDNSEYAYSSTHEMDVEQAYVQSLSNSESWAASGGKSGASFARTSDGRFVIKCISKTELQMFLESAPAYFEYLNKIFFAAVPTVLCKIVGVYHISCHNRVTGKKTMDQVAVMQNIFYKKRISKTFDLKGSRRGRFAANKAKDDNSNPLPFAESAVMTPSQSTTEISSSLGDVGDSDQFNTNGNGDDTNPVTGNNNSGSGNSNSDDEDGTLLDGDFLEYTLGRPMPMDSRANEVFQMGISNDTFFLSIINVLDYSILVGIDEENNELVVGIIDFMRQYDIMKQMERVGKSLPMVVGSEAPTIIQPPLYKKRFLSAMNRYFMTVPNKWTEM